jgi:hypothetical protein
MPGVLECGSRRCDVDVIVVILVIALVVATLLLVAGADRLAGGRS